MGYQINQSDIFPAISTRPTKNGSLVVNPGSPASFGVIVPASVFSTGTIGALSYGDASYESYGIWGTVAKNYPSVTGVPATALGQAGYSGVIMLVGTSGQYHRAASTRLDDVRYYTSPTGAQGNPSPN